MFSRLKPRTSMSGSRMPRRATISSRTGGAAGAVRARIGGPPGGSGAGPGGGGGCREGQDRRPAERFGDGPEAEVVRPEVVAPFADAVVLIDYEERGLRC